MTKKVSFTEMMGILGIYRRISINKKLYTEAEKRKRKRGGEMNVGIPIQMNSITDG